MQIVVAIFESRGLAEDACKRLQTEGVPRDEISLSVLRETGPVPSTAQSELAALEVDPLVLGNVRENFVSFIRNGETAVLVRAATEAEVEFAATTMRQYTPLTIETLELPAAERASSDGVRQGS